MHNLRFLHHRILRLLHVHIIKMAIPMATNYKVYKYNGVVHLNIPTYTRSWYEQPDVQSKTELPDPPCIKFCMTWPDPPSVNSVFDCTLNMLPFLSGYSFSLENLLIIIICWYFWCILISLYLILDNSKPNTPYSNAQPSVSPPPYSPITPLMNKNSKVVELQGKNIFILTYIHI